MLVERFTGCFVLKSISLNPELENKSFSRFDSPKESVTLLSLTNTYWCFAVIGPPNNPTTLIFLNFARTGSNFVLLQKLEQQWRVSAYCNYLIKLEGGVIDKEDFRLTRGFGVSDSKTATLIASTSLACGVVLICSLRTGIFLNMLAAMTTVPWG